jgi:hypothetical protein
MLAVGCDSSGVTARRSHKAGHAALTGAVAGTVGTAMS